MAHRFRLYPEPGQVSVLEMHCAHARFVWNLALEQCGHARMLGQFADQGLWDRQLSEARKTERWLAEGSSSVQQAALRDLRQAFRNWWSNPGHFRHPTWRKAAVNNGFCVRDLSVRKLSRKWAEITVPKAGRVRFRLSRPLPPGAKSARVSRDRAGRWHVAIVAPQPGVARTSTGAAVGLDMGVAATATTSDGTHLRMRPLLSDGEQRRRLRLQRQLARQQKGSNRRAATKAKLARLSAREADRRKDWIEQVTTRLVRDHDLIAIEDLDVANMVRSAKGTFDSPGRNVRAKAGLNRSISAQAWSLFRTRLEQKAAATPEGHRCLVVAIPPAFTSQRCSRCQAVDRNSRESQAVFRCRSCNHTANADVNAASNVLAAGLAVARPSGDGRGGNVRPDTRAVPGRPVETSTTRTGQAA